MWLVLVGILSDSHYWRGLAQYSWSSMGICDLTRQGQGSVHSLGQWMSWQQATGASPIDFWEPGCNSSSSPSKNSGFLDCSFCLVIINHCVWILMLVNSNTIPRFPSLGILYIMEILIQVTCCTLQFAFQIYGSWLIAFLKWNFILALTVFAS